MSEEEFIRRANLTGRDNVRTPIQWDDSHEAGFTTGKPWIKVNPNYASINVKAVLEDADSIFYFYKKMLAFRKQNLTLVYGEYEEISQISEKIYTYRRWDGGGDFYVVLNFSDQSQEFHFNQLSNYDLVIGNYKNGGTTELQP